MEMELKNRAQFLFNFDGPLAVVVVTIIIILLIWLVFPLL